MKSRRIRLTIKPARMAWLKYLLESYEGLALMTTLDAASGLVELSPGVGAEGDLIGLLRDVRDEIGLVAGLSDELELSDHLVSACE